MSKETTISKLFRPVQRYVRAVHLERDFDDVSALKDYVVTDQVHAVVERIVDGLAPGSTQRAWRITGDYGSGKSSLALALAHILSRPSSDLPKQLRSFASKKKLDMGELRIMPVLLTGSREPLSRALLRQLISRFSESARQGREPQFLQQARNLLDSGEPNPDTEVILIIEETMAYLEKKRKAAGLFLVIDELGKFLEYAVLHPERQDVYFLQQLAELSARSRTFPFVVIGILHQGFSAYVARSSITVQKEWEKVAGRFEEIVFRQPLDQMMRLAATALNVKESALPRQVLQVCRQDMKRTLQLGWYGGAASVISLDDEKQEHIVYPLHPSVFPVLVRLFNRFGQNERSLFSFLFSGEPMGLQEFAATTNNLESFYRIYHLYNYIKANLGYRLIHEPGSRWSLLESLVDSYVPQNDEIERRVLETVAVLNLLDSQGLLASEEAIKLAIAGTARNEAARVGRALETLAKRRILYSRGTRGGYCLWPYTSVDIVECYARAEKALGSIGRISSLAEKYLDSRPLVARRHYIETGSLRYFSVHYATVEQLRHTLANLDRNTDGHVVVALCENHEERQQAIEVATAKDVSSSRQVLVAVPKPLEPLTPLFQEARCWEWVGMNVPELGQDEFAEREVVQLLHHARQRLQAAVNDFIGLRHASRSMEISWYRAGRVEEVASGRQFLRLLSAICDEVYPKAPLFHNELINRTQLSSAAAAARMRLIERIFEHPAEEYLGMDPERKPPEMSMYLSVLEHAGLHGAVKGEIGFSIPPIRLDTCNVRPVLDRIQKLLEEAKERKVALTTIIDVLRQPPYGVRDGLILLLIAVFCAIREHHVALYEEGSFVRQISGHEFSRMVKHPEAFELQYYEISGVRSALFHQLLRVLDPGREPPGEANILDVVRPLLDFVAQLPQYSHRTHRLSAEALSVRDVLLAAREPAPLIFRDLPQACGLNEFKRQGGDTDAKRIEQFVRKLRSALDELRAAYPELLARIRHQTCESFGLSGSFDKVRARLGESAERCSFLIREPRLKGFCLRLVDHGLAEEPWLEALGSFLCAKPPKKWQDADIDRFTGELTLLTERFRQAESLAFAHHRNGELAPEHAVRVSLMQQDGTYVDQVIAITKDEADEAERLATEISTLLARAHKRVGLAAASKALWNALQNPEVQDRDRIAKS